MKIESISFEPRAILEFLRKYGKGSQSKDYEFLVSLILSRFCSQQWGIATLIAFQVKSKDAHKLNDNITLSLEELHEILRKQIESDTEIDVIIVPGTIKRHKKEGVAFQIKRFGKDPKMKDTDGLIKYLNDVIPKKYARSEVGLFLILETDEELNFKTIISSLNTKDYPFNSIRYMYSTGGKLIIGDFWPNPGMNEYNPEEFMNDDNI